MGQEGHTYLLTHVGANNSLLLNDSTVTLDAHRERMCKFTPSLSYQRPYIAKLMTQKVVATEKWPSRTFWVCGKYRTASNYDR